MTESSSRLNGTSYYQMRVARGVAAQALGLVVARRLLDIAHERLAIVVITSCRGEQRVLAAREALVAHELAKAAWRVRRRHSVESAARH